MIGGVSNKTEVIEDLLASLDLNGTPRDRILFIGDMEQDVEAGKAAGIHTCAVTDTGYHDRSRLLKSEPDYMISALKNIYAILASNLDEFIRQHPNLMIGDTLDLTSQLI